MVVVVAITNFHSWCTFAGLALLHAKSFCALFLIIIFFFFRKNEMNNLMIQSERVQCRVHEAKIKIFHFERKKNNRFIRFLLPLTKSIAD